MDIVSRDRRMRDAHANHYASDQMYLDLSVVRSSYNDKQMNRQ